MYLKDKKITIAGEDKQILHPGKLWAYYRHVSTSEATNAAINGFKIDMIIVINWRDDIYPGCYLKIGDNNRAYEVTDVDDFEGYKRDLKLHCVKMLKGVTFLPYVG